MRSKPEALNSGYTIKSIYGCRIVFGSVPMADFAMLSHGFSKKALVAADIADRIGATLVIGEPADLDELRKLDLQVSEKRQRDCAQAVRLGLHDVAMWLRTGERGASSNAMCKRIFAIPDDAGADHPYDPDDLRRCLQFLCATDAHDKVSLMADVSPEWGRLVSNWTEITAAFEAESANGKQAPKTYALIKDAIKEN